MSVSRRRRSSARTTSTTPSPTTSSAPSPTTNYRRAREHPPDPPPGGVLRLMVSDIVAGFYAWENHDVDWFPPDVRFPDVDSRFTTWLTWFGTHRSVFTPGYLEQLSGRGRVHRHMVRRLPGDLQCVARHLRPRRPGTRVDLRRGRQVDAGRLGGESLCNGARHADAQLLQGLPARLGARRACPQPGRRPQPVPRRPRHPLGLQGLRERLRRAVHRRGRRRVLRRDAVLVELRRRPARGQGAHRHPGDARVLPSAGSAAASSRRRTGGAGRRRGCSTNFHRARSFRCR